MNKGYLMLLLATLFSLYSCNTKEKEIASAPSRSLDRASEMAQIGKTNITGIYSPNSVYASGKIVYSIEENGIKVKVLDREDSKTVIADLFIQEPDLSLFEFTKRNPNSEGEVLYLGHILVLNDIKNAEHPSLFYADEKIATDIVKSLPSSYSTYNKFQAVGLATKLSNPGSKVAGCTQAGCSAGTSSCSNGECSVSCNSGYSACCKCAVLSSGCTCQKEATKS